MKKVKDILTKKGAMVISIPSNAKIIEALQLMQDSNVGSVVVMDVLGTCRSGPITGPLLVRCAIGG